MLGVWLVLTVAVGFLASGNFRVLDSERMRHADPVYADIPAGDDRRQALRYAASELNRFYFAVYSKAQLVVAGLALAFGLFAIVAVSGGLGGGDVKLMGAVGALVGMPQTMEILVYVALTGLGQTLVTLLARTGFP